MVFPRVSHNFNVESEERKRSSLESEPSTMESVGTAVAGG
jgi:hypothetical protein